MTPSPEQRTVISGVGQSAIGRRLGRDELDLTSAKDGCSPSGQCGCCTVMIDGKVQVSCQFPVARAAGKAITTLEGLGTAEELHPVQRAFIEEQAAQCGFCTNGMIMTTAALLWRNPHPTDEQIREALDGNLCRGGTHLRHP